MTLKLSNLNIVLGYWNENMNQGFRFNNLKQCSNWIILVSFCSSHLAITNATMFILWKFKKLMQKSIFPQKIQNFLCITTKSLYTNSNFKRNYLENYNESEYAVKTKNAPFFMNFPNINQNGNFFLLDWSFKSSVWFAKFGLQRKSTNFLKFWTPF